MNTKPKPIPEDQPALAPYIIVKDAPKAIRFYCEALGAKEIYRLTFDNGIVGHAELSLGAARLLLADEFPDFGALSPVSIGGSPVSMLLYVADVDATVERAVALGATVLRPIKDEFYGDRTGLISCPFGHKWHISSRKEDVSPEEMQRRMNALGG